MDKSLEYIEIRFRIIFLLIIGHFFGDEFLQGENSTNVNQFVTRHGKKVVLCETTHLLLMNDQKIFLNEIFH